MRGIAVGRMNWLFAGFRLRRIRGHCFHLDRNRQIERYRPLWAWLTRVLGRITEQMSTMLDRLLFWRYAPSCGGTANVKASTERARLTQTLERCGRTDRRASRTPLLALGSTGC